MSLYYANVSKIKNITSCVTGMIRIFGKQKRWAALTLFLRAGAKGLYSSSMKLALAVLVYLLIGLVLSWGILLLLAGKPWLFIIAFLAYVVAFGKIGCTAP